MLQLLVDTAVNQDCSVCMRILPRESKGNKHGPHFSRARGEAGLLALILELISHGNHIAGALLLQQSSIQ